MDIHIFMRCMLFAVVMQSIVLCKEIGISQDDSLLDPEVIRSKRQTEAVLEDFCLNRENGQIYPDPVSCRSYIFCSGTFGYKSTCASGLYYNPEVQTCDFDDGRCHGRNGHINSILNQVRSRIPSSLSPQSYPPNNIPSSPHPRFDLDPLLRDSINIGLPRENLNPLRKFDIPLRTPDPRIQNLDPLLKNLDPKNSLDPIIRHSDPLDVGPLVQPDIDLTLKLSAALPTSEELIQKDKERLQRVEEELNGKLATICTGREDGTYLHPEDCHSYVYCSNQHPFPGVCPHDLYYNEQLGGCDFDIEGICTNFGIKTSKDEYKSTRPATTRRITERPFQPDVFNEIPDDIPDQLSLMMPNAIERAMAMLTEKLQLEAEMSKQQADFFMPVLKEGPIAIRSNRPFKLVQQFLKTQPIAKQLSMSAFVLNSASQEIVKELGIDTVTGLSMLQSLTSPLPPNSHRLHSDDVFPQPEPGSCPWPMYSCRISKYRSYDGACNNLHFPIRGRSLTPFKRFLAPVYGDGMGSFRGAVNGGPLPPAREISYTVAEHRDLPNHIQTVMLMQWGQFVDHDLTLTALSKIVTEPTGYGSTDDIECGTDGCSTENEACVPITIPDDDPVFTGKKCLEFVRSQEVPNINCTMGPREQLNQITSYLDSSNVYGSNKEEADKLREPAETNRGSLRFTRHPFSGSLKYLLPRTSEDKDCKDFDEQQQCFRAGDERVNEQNALTVMHTMWLREHNRIEEKLHELNPDWDGDTLYQETRRIIGAMMQHISYNEFLPTVLGPIQMEESGLQLKTNGYYNGYNSSVDASVSNAFASAAYRFGHTLIPNMITRTNSSYHKGAYPSLNLNELFFRPKQLYNTDVGGVDGFVRGLCGQKAQTYDRFITKEVTQHLFSQNPPHGLGTDLVSLNIMRARDHGVPGYNAWREWCGLKKAENFDDLLDVMTPENIKRLQQLYSHVDDIDLFPAGISERPVEGGLIGTTFACIVGRQFRDLRQGDRFWYENNGSNRFSPDQLKEIRKVSLAKVLCTNSDNITSIQPRVMELPFREAYPTNKYTEFHEKQGLNERWFSKLWNSQHNQRVSCDCLPEIDLTKWKE